MHEYENMLYMLGSLLIITNTKANIVELPHQLCKHLLNAIAPLMNSKKLSVQHPRTSADHLILYDNKIPLLNSNTCRTGMNLNEICGRKKMQGLLQGSTRDKR